MNDEAQCHHHQQRRHYVNRPEQVCECADYTNWYIRTRTINRLIRIHIRRTDIPIDIYEFVQNGDYTNWYNEIGINELVDNAIALTSQRHPPPFE